MTQLLLVNCELFTGLDVFSEAGQAVLVEDGQIKSVGETGSLTSCLP